jgi:hypothetical protein
MAPKSLQKLPGEEEWLKFGIKLLAGPPNPLRESESLSLDRTWAFEED